MSERLRTVVHHIRWALPVEGRVYLSELRRANRTERANVLRHLTIPPTLASSPRRPGSVWGVAMMRNEQDTVRHVVEHMFDQGVDAVLIADNGSTDATPEILRALSETYPIHIVRDDLVAYLQGTKMTALASIARRAGADWIVPFDADELWFGRDRPLASALRASGASVLTADIHNVFPAFDDDADEPDPFLRLRHIDPVPSSMSKKVAFRAHRFARVEMGNGDVLRRGPRSDGLFIAHFPWRTYGQLVGKLRQGREALTASNLSDNHGFHWRIAGAWTDDALDACWSDLLAGRPVDDLCWSPVGVLSTAAPGTARTWSQLWSGAEG